VGEAGTPPPPPRPAAAELEDEVLLQRIDALVAGVRRGRSN
jgi:hypothetical protein